MYEEAPHDSSPRNLSHFSPENKPGTNIYNDYNSL